MGLKAAAGALAQPSGWEAADQVFGQTGKDLPGDVHRYGWPRADLHVSVGGVSVQPGLDMNPASGGARESGTAYLLNGGDGADIMLGGHVTLGVNGTRAWCSRTNSLSMVLGMTHSLAGPSSSYET